VHRQNTIATFRCSNRRQARVFRLQAIVVETQPRVLLGVGRGRGLVVLVVLVLVLVLGTGGTAGSSAHRFRRSESELGSDWVPYSFSDHRKNFASEPQLL
jgi:hypothetical protein